MSTATDTEILPDIDEETTEPDGLAHYVRIKALIAGGPVVALCGKRYVPRQVGPAVVDRDLCPKCNELMGLLESFSGESR